MWPRLSSPRRRRSSRPCAAEQYQDTKNRIEDEKSKTAAGEMTATEAELAVAEGEKELKVAEKPITFLMDQMLWASQHLFSLRQERRTVGGGEAHLGDLRVSGREQEPVDDAALVRR
jgi:hypothetical protein